jgi:predicted MFS family arabinose efflux permease
MTRGWPLVWALSAAQLVSWGAVYYSFSLFVVPMESELGWSRAQLNGALSLGLLVSGLAAYPVGARIDRKGGRAVMALGSLVATALLAAWARVDSLALFYAIWLGLGLALAATLYEPVFAVITRAFPADYRRRITALTLVGGFASTVFIPLTQLFIDALGWRGALVALALCNAAITLPVHALLLRDGGRAGASDEAARAATQEVGDAALRRALAHPVFWVLAVCFTAYYATFSALTFHIIPLLTERQVPTGIIVAAIATIGPAQVAGRVVLLALGRRFSTAVAGRLAFLGLPGAVLLLLALPTSTAGLFAFAAVYGAANGVITIIRGTAVPDLLWREGYGAINGALTLPANIARAAAPFGAALVWSAAGSYDAVLWSILAGGALAALAFWLAAARAAPQAR